MNAETKRKKKLLKIFVISLSSLILLCVIAFWVMTGSSFITRFILPVLSDSIELRIDASYVDLSVFKSRLTAKNVVIGSGKTALVKADKLDISYSIWDLLKQRFVFRDVVLDRAVITIAKDSGGRWTYEPSVQAVTNVVSKKSASSNPNVTHTKQDQQEKVFLDLKNIQIINSSFILAAGDISKASARLELHDLNINLAEFTNNKPGTLTLKSRVTIQSDGGITVEQGDWNLTLTAAFDDYLLPYQINLSSKLDKLDGIINGVKINNSNLTLDIDAHGDKKSIVINKFCLRQNDKEFIKTDVELDSHINFEPLKIKGKIKVAPISAEIISIICQFSRQVNPGEVGVNWVSGFEYSESRFSGAGKLKLTRRKDAIIAGKKYKLPNLSLNSKYDFDFDGSKNALHVEYFNAELKEQDKKVLSLNTDKAFTYLLDKQIFLEKESPQITLELRQLDLNMMKLLQAPGKNFIVHNGQLDGDMVCILDRERKLRFDAKIKADNLDFQIDSKRFENFGFEQRISGYISKNLFLSIPELNFEFSYKQKKLVNFAGAADIDFKKRTVDFSINMPKFSTEKIAHLPLPQKTIDDIVKITSKLEPFSLTAFSSGNIRLDEGTMKINPVKLNIFQKNKKIVDISIKPHDGMIDNLLKSSTTVLTIDKLPIKQFRRIMDDNILNDGYLNGKIIAKVQKSLNSIILDSVLNIDGLELLSNNKVSKDLCFNTGFSASVIDLDEIFIREFVCGMRQKQRVILGLSGFGSMKLSKGNGKLDLSLDYLNHNLLNILTSGEFKNGILKGSLKVAVQDDFKHLNVKSNLDIMQLISAGTTDAVEGKGSFELAVKPELFHCKEFAVSLNSKDGKIVDINGSTTLPAKKSADPVLVSLSSKIIDIQKIQQLFAVKNKTAAGVEIKEALPENKQKTAKNTPLGKNVPLQFDLGKKKYVLLIDLQGITFNSILNAHVSGKIFGEGHKIAVEYLQIGSNKDKLNYKGDFLSTPEGVKYHNALKSDRFNLTPIFKTFLNDEYKKIKITLNNLHADLAGTGLRPSPLWDNMKGFVRTDFADIKIPNNLSKTTMGKILLLPFEIMVDIQKMIPARALKEMGQVAKYVVDFRNDMKILTFNEGSMDLESADGIIFIKDFHLNGKIVRNLSFDGKFGLGTNQMLRLNSRLDINGIILPVNMSGTIHKPEINYSATTINFMRANAFTILDTTGEILEKGGGDVKKILDIIFK